jgi:hypothetical protein
MIRRIDLPIDEHLLKRAVTEWEPRKEPHCSNCRHAIVSEGTRPNKPEVECARGHGKGPADLFRLIRPSNPRGFRQASECPDFSSMSDEDAP